MLFAYFNNSLLSTIEDNQNYIGKTNNSAVISCNEENNKTVVNMRYLCRIQGS